MKTNDISVGDLVRHRLFQDKFGDVQEIYGDAVLVHVSGKGFYRWYIANTQLVATLDDVAEMRST